MGNVLGWRSGLAGNVIFGRNEIFLLFSLILEIILGRNENDFYFPTQLKYKYGNGYSMEYI